MLLLGGLSLAACLILPPWREMREMRLERDRAEQRIARLEQQLALVSKQIEHLRNDPAYLERLSRREFGEPTPGVEFTPVQVEPLPVGEGDPGSDADPREEIAVAIESASHNNPFVSVFVLDETRPIVMIMSALMIVVALVLLLRGGPARHAPGPPMA
jgi:hypothetical protein